MSDPKRDGLLLECLPECRWIPFADIYREHGDAPPDTDWEWAEQAGILRCAEGCPSRQEGIERGRELARKHGW